jgi:hypothetical protein
MTLNKIISHPKLSNKQKADILEQLTYVWNGAEGVEAITISAVINYNYMVFYHGVHGRFVMTMGFFLPSFEQDLIDRGITVRLSPVQLEMLLP